MSRQQATASPLVQRYTLDQFFTLDTPRGGGHYELIAGVLYMVPPPSGVHNLAASRLVGVLAAYATAHPKRCTLFVPRTAIWTAADTYLEPDLFLVKTQRLRSMDPGRISTADLVVEILSPGTSVYDRTAKGDTYAALGVAELWLVDLEARTVEQRVLARGRWQIVGRHSGDKTFRARTFAGLSVVPRRLFE